MRRIKIIALASILLFACTKPAEREATPLLRTVPSRSLVVAHFGHLGHALELLLDSTSVFRSIDYGRFANEEAILSYDYSAAMIPLLSIDAGRPASDTSAAVGKILEQAEEKGLYAFYTADLLPKRAAVLLSTSKTAVKEAEEHIRAGVSVLDAQGFPGAFALAGSAAGSIILKNASASRWLPADFLRKDVVRKELNRFVAGISEWTVLDFVSYSFDSVTLKFGSDGSIGDLAELFARLEAGDCKAASAVPASSDFVLGLALKDAKAYSELWQECLDVRSDLSKYKGRIAGLRKRCGKNPHTWLSEKNLRELVLVRWEGREVLLLRGGKVKAAGAAQNPCPGFVPALFGEAFRIADDSFCASASGWSALGSEADVNAWLGSLPSGDSLFRGIPKSAKCYFVNNDFGIVSDNKKTELYVK